MNKQLPLFFLSILLLSCHSGQGSKKLNEKTVFAQGQILENLKKDNELLKQRLSHLENKNKTLKHDLENIYRNLYLQEKIEEQGFLKEKPTKDIQILKPGDFHGNEINNGVANLDWYGIFKQENNFTLKKTKLDVKPRHDVIVDSKDKNTGKKVTSIGTSEPIILIAGLKDIQEGEIESVKLEKKILYPGEKMNIEFNGYWISFTAYGSFKWFPQGGRGLTNYLLEIRSSKDDNLTSQIFAGTKGFDDAMFSFIWAGDIDRDGLLDLIMDLSNHYNLDNTTLFLSSKAEVGQIIKKVSEFKTGGC